MIKCYEVASSKVISNCTLTIFLRTVTMSLPSVYGKCLSTNSLQSRCNLFKKINLCGLFRTSLPSTLVISLQSLYHLI